MNVSRFCFGLAAVFIFSLDSEIYTVSTRPSQTEQKLNHLNTYHGHFSARGLMRPSISHSLDERNCSPISSPAVSQYIATGNADCKERAWPWLVERGQRHVTVLQAWGSKMRYLLPPFAHIVTPRCAHAPSGPIYCVFEQRHCAVLRCLPCPVSLFWP